VKVAFLGTPEIAVPTLRGLHDAGHQIDIVVTNPDAKRGRGSVLSPSPVKAAAVELGLTVSHDPDDVLASGAELGVVVAYGRILRANLLAHLPLVNLHFSLLPRWRGAAPVERAILAGDDETGVCVMAVEPELDTGGIYASARTPVDDKTLAELWSELSATGTQLLLDWMPGAFAEGRLVDPEPQVGEVTYAAKLTADDRRIDDADPPALRLAKVRLGNAWTNVDGKRLKVLDASLDPDGSFRMVTVQPEGRRPMPYDAWRRGSGR
jgi:methionyl-tRNA formyltransferase